MADVIFPNFANALTQGLQARQAMDTVEQTQRRKDLAPDVSAAISGQDPGALGRIAGVDPDYAIKLGPILDKLDADKQAVLKRASDFTIQMGMGVLNSPPEQRPAAYEAAKMEAQRLRIPTESWPASYGPQAEGFLQFNVNKAVPVAKWFEEKEKTAREQIVPGIPGPGGGPTYQAGGVTPQTQQAFIQQMAPHVMQVAQATGQDPRIVMAQAALETGFGTKMVGNNYFGIKGGNGPAVATQEADANGNLVPAQAQFRSYAGPAESAQDYAQLIATDPHYAGLRDVIKKGGDLNAQIDALGKSGYATDPNYAAKVRAIAFGLPTPGAQGPSPVQVAYGRNPVVASPGGGAMDLSNTPPAQVNPNTPPPAFQVVQGAPGGPGSGIQTVPPQQRDANHPENRGYVPGNQHGVQMEKGGYFLYVNPQNTKDTVWYKPPTTAQFIDVKDENGNLIGQREMPSNKYHPMTVKAGALTLPVELKDSHGDALTNSEWYKGQNFVLRQDVEGVLSGDIPLSTLPKRPGGGADLATIIALARQVKPDWSPNEGTQRQTFEKNITNPDSKTGQTIAAFNVAPRHALDLIRITDALNQQNPMAAQDIINGLKRQFGDTAVPDMMAARNLVALEFLRAAVGPGALNVTLEKEFMNSIPTGATSDQVRQVVSGYVDKMLGRAHVYQETAREYGSPESIQNKILLPETKRQIDLLKGPRIGAPGTPEAGQPVPPQRSWWDRITGGGQPGPQGPPPNAAGPQGPRPYAMTPDGRPVYMTPQGPTLVPP